MELKIIVTAKQVPDTHNISGQAMKEDGTVNRAALPAIFNPEDLNALEMAISLKERFDAQVTVVCMGPPRAADILRESLYRGADRVVLVTDRAFAGADTLATSYTLAQAVKKVGGADLVLCGRQAIDGDTAQVGPQLAEKVPMNQITYVEEVVNIQKRRITLRRSLGRSSEVLEAGLPLLLTVTASANQPRSFGAKYLMKFKKAKTRIEVEEAVKAATPGENYAADWVTSEVDKKCAELSAKGLLIETWTAADLKCTPESIGLAGSPTKVKKIENVVLAARDIKKIAPTEAAIKEFMQELIQEKTFV
ncbi:MAG: electron transfer flavoprotein subunit beta [Elusimicrobia bacterium RIFOXYB2_FULL_49_7]|nr:MAG: electron transfer flavoprotein subunit beta [Elusimicrobia bacterium RIFOXYB2_FULL_49_7]